jgi:hypothetical protein
MKSLIISNFFKKIYFVSKSIGNFQCVLHHLMRASLFFNKKISANKNEYGCFSNIFFENKNHDYKPKTLCIYLIK